MLTDPHAEIAGRTPGLPDDAFDHDGLVTKQVVRAYALAQLRPLAGQVLWDIGAGAGSIAIEWCRTDPTCRALAVELNPVRAARCRANAERLSDPGQVSVVEGDALDSMARWLEEGQRPDAVFFGGGVTAQAVEAAWEALPPGGRLVMHGVTLETEAVLIGTRLKWGGQLARIGVESCDQIGRLTGWRPARTIVTWCGVR